MNPSPLQIGPYALGQLITDYPAAQKISWWGKISGTRKTKRGETLYDVGHIELAQIGWHLALGVSGSRIQRLSAQHACRGKTLMEARFVELFKYWQQRCGGEKPAGKEYDPVWHTPHGTVTLVISGVGNTDLFQIGFEVAENENK